jgi:hypothetical protein
MNVAVLGLGHAGTVTAAVEDVVSLPGYEGLGW